MVVHTCNSSTLEVEAGESGSSRSASGYLRPRPKKTTNKQKTRWVAVASNSCTRKADL